MIMKYGIGVLILIVCMFGYMYKHNKDQRAELQKEHEARIQVEKQNQIDAEQREKQHAIEQQQKEQALKDMQAQKEHEASEKIKLAEIAVKQQLIDPESAQFRNQNGNCGEVNSKNRVGGYTGFQRYIATPELKFAYFDQDHSPLFQESWDKSCK